MPTRNPHATFSSRTHGSGIAAHPGDAVSELRRTLTTTLLFEPSYYAKADETAALIHRLTGDAGEQAVPEIIYARVKAKIRMAPLWAAACLAHSGGKTRTLIPQIVLRPDEACELLTMYWHLAGKNAPLDNQLKRGLADALRKFSPYQLAKWQERSREVKLGDVVNLVHPKPRDVEQSAAFKGLLDGSIESPDTWEVALSSGADKKETWTRLLIEKRLGYMALLMNLRNMTEAGVEQGLMERGLIDGAANSWALPMRFVTASRAAPKLEAALDTALGLSLAGFQKLLGRTLVVVDVSGSMRGPIAGRSKLDRIDAAGALTALAAGICERITIYATAGDDIRQFDKTVEIPARANLGALDAMRRAMAGLGGGGIFLAQCMNYIAEREAAAFDRVLVFTDEQDTDSKLRPDQARKLGTHNYIMNIAAYKHGIATDGGWQRISGYSERVFDWIRVAEGLEATEGEIRQ